MDGKQYGIARQCPFNSIVRLTAGNGYGSTGNRVRRYSTIVEFVGGDVTYFDSAVNGATFTINTPGVYSLTRSDGNSAASVTIGWSNNAEEYKATTIDTVPTNKSLIWTSTPSGTAGCVTITVPLRAGDRIRPHDGSAADASSNAWLCITRVA